MRHESLGLIEGIVSRTIPAGDIVGVNCTANNLIAPTQKFYMIGNVIFVHEEIDHAAHL